MKNHKIYILLLIMSFSLPIFIYTDGYRDDFIRNIDKVYIWEKEGRPFSLVIAMIVNFGKTLFNISPLSQILSIFIMYKTSCTIADRYFKNVNSILYTVGGTSLFLTPFFIQNLSYQYDAVTITSSIFLCVCAVCVQKWYNKSALIMLSLCTYQQAIPLFFILSFADFIKNRQEKDSFVNSASGVSSILLYKLIIVNFFISHNYAKKISHQINIFSNDGIGILIKNIDNYFSFYLWHYNGFIKAIVIILLVFFIFSLFNFIKSNHEKKHLKIAALVLTASLSVGSILLFCSFSNIVLQPRSFIWPGAFIFVLILSSLRLHMHEIVLTSISLIMCFYSFSVMSVYSTAYKHMISYEKDTLLSISLSGFVKNNTIYTYGVMPRGEMASNAVRKYSFLGSSLLTMISESRGTYLAKTNNYNIKINQFKGGDSDFTCENYVYTWNDTYNIHKINSIYVIDFKRIKSCDITS